MTPVHLSSFGPTTLPARGAVRVSSPAARILPTTRGTH